MKLVAAKTSEPNASTWINSTKNIITGNLVCHNFLFFTCNAQYLNIELFVLNKTVTKIDPFYANDVFDHRKVDVSMGLESYTF